MKEYTFYFFWMGNYGKFGSTEVRESREVDSLMSKDDIVKLIDTVPNKTIFPTFLKKANYYWWRKDNKNYVPIHIAGEWSSNTREEIQLHNDDIVHIQILPPSLPPGINPTTMTKKQFEAMSRLKRGGRLKRKRKKSKSTKKLTKRRRKYTKRLTKRRHIRTNRK